MVDILFIELKSLLSYVKQMYRQPSHLIQELILWIQITRRKIDINGDSVMKSPCWNRVSNLQPSYLDLLWFSNVPSLQDLAIFMAPHGQALLRSLLDDNVVWSFCYCRTFSRVTIYPTVLWYSQNSCSASIFFAIGLEKTKTHCPQNQTLDSEIMVLV